MIHITQPTFGDRRVVGIADLAVSAAPDVLVTYALGSCLGVTLYDPVARVGGLLHVMLPESAIDPAKAREKPAMFIDTGVPLLFRTCYAAGAVKQRLVVNVIGGAATQDTQDFFQVGKRNFLKVREMLWKNGVMLSGADVGGTQSRTVSLDVATGVVVVRSNGTDRVFQNG